MKDYFRHIDYLISAETKALALELAKDEAFMDNSYHISFFKLPGQLEDLGLPFQLQILKQTEKVSKIHRDKNRFNEFDGTWIPRNCIMNFPLCGSGETYFYDEDKNFVCKTDYKTYGAILNTGKYFHNIILNTDEPRIALQFCFEENFDEVSKIYDNCLFGRTY